MSRTSGYSSGSPGEPRRSPLTIGCPRNWMNMWSYGFTMLAPPNSCWRTEAFVRGWCLKNGFLVGFFGHPTGLMNQKKSWLLAGFSGKTSHTVDRVKLKIFFCDPVGKGKRKVEYIVLNVSDWRQPTCTTYTTYHDCKVRCTSWNATPSLVLPVRTSKIPCKRHWTVSGRFGLRYFVVYSKVVPPRGSSWEFLWAQTTTSTCWFYVTPELVTDLNRLNT